MSQTISGNGAIYLISELQAVGLFPADREVIDPNTGRPVEMVDAFGSYQCWTVRAGWHHRHFDQQPDLCEVLVWLRSLSRPRYKPDRQVFDSRTSQYVLIGTARFDPALDAESLGRKIRDRAPLTAAQLLYEPEFAHLARQVAESGKGFSQELLTWEKKTVVQEAVAIVAAQVAIKRAEQARREGDRAEQARLQAERERPTVEAVRAAYEQCEYRTARQGHITEVILGASPSISSDTRKGERYSSRCTFSKMESVHKITVARDWLATVPEDLQIWDSCLVLLADIVGHTGDHKYVVRKLLLVRQGQGTSLVSDTVMVCQVRDEYSPLSKKQVESMVCFSDPRIARDACIDARLIE